MAHHDRLLEVVALALSTVSAAGIGDTGLAAPKKSAEAIECFGVNSCKGTNGCAVGKAQIKVANEVFHDQFTKSALVDCSGTTECAAKSGHLAWVTKADNAACFKDGGFIFEKDAKGAFVVRTKDGPQKPKA